MISSQSLMFESLAVFQLKIYQVGDLGVLWPFVVTTLKHFIHLTLRLS